VAAFDVAMVLVAHPDDADFMCGGTVARWVAEGSTVHYVLCTDGSAGSNVPGVTREEMRVTRAKEQRDAAEALGVASVTILGELDGMLEVTLETRKKVCREVRRLRPDVLVAPDPSRLWSGNGYINHSDHRAAGTLALTAIMPDAPSRPMFPELLEEGLEPFEVPNLWLSSDEGEELVDITDAIDRKLQALAQHVSQEAEAAAPWVREHARELGERAGVEYAECFRTFKLVQDHDED
jgi:LmbE family N-acetylglucosaminyl deacetylase